jgi:hypothetical protein
MLNKLRWSLFAISSCYLTESCTPKPPDVPVCEQLSSRVTTDPVTRHTVLTASPACWAAIHETDCGHCVWIVSGKEQFVGEAKATFINGKPWSQLKSESAYLPAAESYGPLAEYIINSCKKMKCDSQVDAFRIKLDSLNGISGAITGGGAQ